MLPSQIRAADFEARNAAILRDLENGMGTRQLAARYGMSQDGVRKMLNRLGYSAPGKTGARTTDEDLLPEVRKLLAAGLEETTICNRLRIAATRCARLVDRVRAEQATEAAGQGERRESEAPPPAAHSIVMSLMARGYSRENAERQAKWEMHKRVHGLNVREAAE